jgi:hypothetical protein
MPDWSIAEAEPGNASSRTIAPTPRHIACLDLSVRQYGIAKVLHVKADPRSDDHRWASRKPGAADLKSLTHSRRNRVQGLQIESGTGGADLTFAKSQTARWQANVKSKAPPESILC